MNRFPQVKHFIVSGFFLVLWLMSGCSDSTDPDPESLASFRIEVPAEVTIGEPFDLAVTAVGSQGTTPYKVFDGPVLLSVSEGSISPESIMLVNGVGRAPVTLVGEAGSATITATGKGKTGSVSLGSVPLASIPGDPNDPVQGAIPNLPFQPRAADYVGVHPEMGEVGVSFNNLTLIFRQGVTIGRANALLAEHGATIAGGVKGQGDSVLGLLFLRLPTADHAEMSVVMESLDSDDRVELAVLDQLSETTEIPAFNGGNPADWIWEVDATGANWGLEKIRVPQMWNLNDALEKKNAVVETGIMDNGFRMNHPDGELFYDLDLSNGKRKDHGTHVAGTIAATVDNGLGVDGVNPYARLNVAAPVGDVFSNAWKKSVMKQFQMARPGIRVVNVSLGNRWHLQVPAINPGTSPALRAQMRRSGAAAKVMLENLGATGRVPLIINAAGNASGSVLGNVDAKYNLNFANAALEHGVQDIIVVEAVDNATGGVARYPSSNINGHVSAPGVDIVSTMNSQGYGPEEGTSMAAPHVAGLAGYLFALDPTLTNTEVKSLLVNNVSDGGGASGLVDAFASAMDIDAVRGDDKILRMLLDVDDGTVDGNQRIEFDQPSLDLTETDDDSDGGRGDKKIDMSDFRAWRDWLLQVENPPGLDLDGSPAHDKKDLNRDHTVGSPADENIYPRGDFNGDGILDRSARSFVPGAVQNLVTDLEVLQEAFADPHYTAQDLPGLLDSGDIHVFPLEFLLDPEIQEVRSFVTPVGSDQVLEERTHTGNAATYAVYTLATGDYTLHAEGFDGSGDVVCEEMKDVTLEPGSDFYWDPVCIDMVLQVDFPAVVQYGTPTPLLVTVGFEDGQGGITHQAGVQLDLLATGGTVAPATGLTNASGEFNAQGTLLSPASNITIFITATHPASGKTVTTSVTANADGGGEAPLTIVSSTTRVEANCWVGVREILDEEKNIVDSDPLTPFIPFSSTQSASVYASDTAPDGSTGSVSLEGEAFGSTTNTLDASTGKFVLSGNYRASGSLTETGFGGGGAGSFIGRSALEFEVVGSAVDIVVSGTNQAESTECDVASVGPWLRYRDEDLRWHDIFQLRDNGGFDYSGTLEPGLYHLYVGAYASPATTSGCTASTANATCTIRFEAQWTP